MAEAEGLVLVGSVLQKCLHCPTNYPFESRNKREQIKKTYLWQIYFNWLGIKNDYRTLIGVDSLDIIEKEEDDDSEENGDV